MTDELTALVLHGGGALGAYQGGAVEGILRSGSRIDWVAGISIGAINAAILCGNAPDERVARLRMFWERISARTIPDVLFEGMTPRGLYNEWSAATTAMAGVPGFFRLRFMPAAMMPPGTEYARSFYDTSPLRKTLLELVDFDRLNAGEVRFSVGAVNVETGNMTWFDSDDTRIGPEHVMASAALPPGFPAIEIDGAHYWDGGLVSNTPLQYVLDERMPDEDLCVFQVDLFDARGELPQSVWTSEAREKDIRFSSRTRMNTDMMKRLHDTHETARRLYDKLPPALKDDPDAKALINGNANPRITIAHLIYRKTRFERQSKDYEFSRWSMQDHWAAGLKDAERTLAHADWKNRSKGDRRIQVFDLGNA